MKHHDMIIKGRRASGEPRSAWEPEPRPWWWFDQRKGCVTADGKPDYRFTSESQTDLYEAVGICKTRCPFVRECRKWADQHGERHGVWGGESRGITLRKTIRTSRTVPATSLGVDDEVARALAGNGLYFRTLSSEVKGAAVRAGLAQGITLAKLAQRFMTRMADLEVFAGADGDNLDQRIAERHAAGLNDHQIALAEAVSVTTVADSRTRQGLDVLYGSWGVRKPVSA